MCSFHYSSSHTWKARQQNNTSQIINTFCWVSVWPLEPMLAKNRGIISSSIKPEDVHRCAGRQRGAMPKITSCGAGCRSLVLASALQTLY